MGCPRCGTIDDCGAGWLTPRGQFIACPCDAHDRAVRNLGETVGGVELKGWVRVYAIDDRHFVEPHLHWLSVTTPTTRQLDWLHDHGYRVEQ